MKKILEVITHPVTYANLLIIGTFILIEFFHTHAHYKMEIDVHGYCRQLESNNKYLEENTYEEDW